ncbi:hypothetical protein B0H14DRAFT_3150305 [Mycena olivaceomarginata]|nr:hypothetical protein B0H14DRAFT_3150305 [Mycena olivaceomarginata]
MTAYATYCEKAAEASERPNLVTQRKPLKTAPLLPPHHFTRSACRPYAHCSAGSAASTITKDEKDNEGEMDTFPEALENIVRVDVTHDAEAVFLDAWAAAALARSLMDLDGVVLAFDGAEPRQLMAVAGAVLIALDGAPLLMAGVGRDEQIKDKRVDMGGFSLYLRKYNFHISVMFIVKSVGRSNFGNVRNVHNQDG